MKAFQNMKAFLKNQSVPCMAAALALMLALTLIPACFDGLGRLSKDGAALLLGWPFAFYTIHAGASGFGVHLALGSFLCDLAVCYLMAALAGGALRRLKAGRMS